MPKTIYNPVNPRMSEENESKPVESTENNESVETTETEVETTPVKTPKTFTEEEHKAGIEKAVKNRFKNFVAKDVHDQLSTKLTETETLLNNTQKERDSFREELSKLKKDKWISEIGTKYGIPESDWDRLKGENEKELEADAKAWQEKRNAGKKIGDAVPATPHQTGKNEDFNSGLYQLVGVGGR